MEVVVSSGFTVRNALKTLQHAENANTYQLRFTHEFISLRFQRAYLDNNKPKKRIRTQKMNVRTRFNL
jgi:hypothetical protein